MLLMNNDHNRQVTPVPRKLREKQKRKRSAVCQPRWPVLIYFTSTQKKN